MLLPAAAGPQALQSLMKQCGRAHA
jgi:hypothetical protein